MKIFKTSFLRRRTIVISYDLLMIPIAWIFAYWLRHNLHLIPAHKFISELKILPIIMASQVPFYWLFGLYRGVWAFASIFDLLRILKAVLSSVLISIVILYLAGLATEVPRSLFTIYPLLLIAFLGGSRLFVRWMKEYRPKSSARRVLIIGAGKAGEGVVRDMLRHHVGDYYPIGFVDDDRYKRGREIHGVRVLGNTAQISSLVSKYNVGLIIIATPSARASTMQRIIRNCENAQVPIRTLPGLNDLVGGKVSINAIREVSIEDLLGRDPVSLDRKNIQVTIANRCVLVTGGGGSIGSELCRQIASFAPEQLIVIDHSEFNLYSLEIQLSEQFPNLNIVYLLADVSDRVAIKAVFENYAVNVVFHAAAFKHVPLLENQIRAAVANNVMGTRTIAEIAAQYRVSKFILISTDKAVNPANIMGATKRIAEIFAQNFDQNCKTQFITVRFGNVLGSRGSVVPLFREQIAKGGPVTVTHPEITRFFMTIPEAAQLILQATVMGKGGEIFVLDMGEPIKISYLAEQMIILSGLKPHEDIQIHYTGLRAGEKLFEELFHESESLVSTQHKKILRARYRNLDWEMLLEKFNLLEKGCKENNMELLEDVIYSLVPEISRKSTIKIMKEARTLELVN